MSEPKHEILVKSMEQAKKKIIKFCTDWVIKGVLKSQNQIRFSESKIDINKVRSQIGMVFQHFNLFAHLNVLNNVCIGLIKVKKMKKRDAVERAKHEITRVGLADKINAYPGQLSGGQQ